MDSCNYFHEMIIHSTLKKKWLQMFGRLTRTTFREKMFLGTTLSLGLPLSFMTCYFAKVFVYLLMTSVEKIVNGYILIG